MINNFIESLKYSPKRADVFNPWWETDPENDIDDQGSKIRSRQLFQYLNERIGKAKYLLVAEAIGYQGGHFTGIPMTSERILLGGHAKKGISPEQVFSEIEPERTSRPDLKPNGFSEPTATIVWGHIIQSNLNPKDFILWNAFPWHPFKSESGYLSNRTPTAGEVQAGAPILTRLIQITKTENIVAVGEKSFNILDQLGIHCIKVRHPANGGATKFRKQLTKIIS
ncbi:MAG: uracil-DNA glycosylase [Deltaproteobacteria bacterium]|nr:uracil-DNA glycosylase [Deltaproteobacteria bacterium]